MQTLSTPIGGFKVARKVCTIALDPKPVLETDPCLKCIRFVNANAQNITVLTSKPSSHVARFFSNAEVGGPGTIGPENHRLSKLCFQIVTVNSFHLPAGFENKSIAISVRDLRVPRMICHLGHLSSPLEALLLLGIHGHIASSKKVANSTEVL